MRGAQDDFRASADYGELAAVLGMTFPHTHALRCYGR